ncbi:hypothetical protein LB505_007884 [Fusarium chuoi]|nr:hypothetical protein LB505_007884 [Fusarium chuoi]
MFRNLEDVEFETVIIDEAAQCVELSALIPLKYGCYKCILVGDPKQLPPTVLSQSAAKFGYDQTKPPTIGAFAGHAIPYAS